LRLGFANPMFCEGIMVCCRWRGIICAGGKPAHQSRQQDAMVMVLNPAR
jgi:hypothetical protein